MLKSEDLIYEISQLLTGSPGGLEHMQNLSRWNVFKLKKKKTSSGSKKKYLKHRLLKRHRSKNDEPAPCTMLPKQNQVPANKLPELRATCILENMQAKAFHGSAVCQ